LSLSLVGQEAGGRERERGREREGERQIERERGTAPTCAASEHRTPWRSWSLRTESVSRFTGRGRGCEGQVERERGRECRVRRREEGGAGSVWGRTTGYELLELSISKGS
jgi:hypothetical protein